MNKINQEQAIATKAHKLQKVYEIYKRVQLLQLQECKEGRENLAVLSDAWKDNDIPLLQGQVVDQQLKNLREGIIDPVFAAVIEALNSLPIEDFTLLDAACASGYYSEVIRSQISKIIHYRGSDYSEAMIEHARNLYPELEFDVDVLGKDIWRFN